MKIEFLVTILLIAALILGFVVGRGTNAFAAELPHDSATHLVITAPAIVEV